MRYCRCALVAAFSVFLASLAYGADLPPEARAEASNATALDRYVYEPDPSYTYSVAKTVDAEGWTGHIIDLTSQTWRNEAEVDRIHWKHWLTLIQPDEVRFDTALLFIGGGRNGNPPPEKVDPMLVEIARKTQSIVVELGQVPNQPLTFTDLDRELYEDDFIAYTWDKFLHTGDATWLARLPMTKSAVKAMDTVQDFCAGENGDGPAIRHFMVAGGSKRGWTTWTTGAVDQRVVAIAPIVIDMLNLVPSFQHHWQAYGRWSTAVNDYVNHGVMKWMGTPEFDALLELVDPFSYRDRLTMPKYMLNSSGDQFFLPDSAQFYWDELKGPKYIRYVPNTDHGLDGSDAPQSLLAFYASILTQTPLPRYDWDFPQDNTVHVSTPDKPVAVKLWQAYNPEARDFRLQTIGKAWEASDVAADGDGSYSATVDVPEKGWRAFMLELTFNGPAGTELKVTTPVKVAPADLPYTYEPPAETPHGFITR